jgi:MFS family permease
MNPRLAGVNRRVATAGVAYAFAVTMVGTTMPTPLYPIYERQFGFSALTVTLVYAAYGIGVLLALLLFGQLSDLHGRRRVLLPGLALSALSSVIFLLAQGVAALFVGRIVSGLSAGVFTGTATAALLDLAAPEHRSRATLLATAVTTMGLGTGALLAGVLAEVAPAPLRTPYAVQLGLLVPAACLVWLMPEPAASDGGARVLHVARLRVPAEVRGTFVRAATAGFASFATMGMFSAVAPAFLAQLLGLPNHALTGAVVFAVFSASTAGQLLLEMFPARHALPSGCAIMIAGMALIAAALADSSLPLLLLGAVVAGFGAGVCFRAGLAMLAAETPTDHRGEVNSSFFAVAYLALSVPIIGVGFGAEALGLRGAGLVFTACVAVLALAVLLSLSVRARRGAVSSSRPGQSPDKPRSAATAGSTDNP